MFFRFYNGCSASLWDLQAPAVRLYREMTPDGLVSWVEVSDGERKLLKVRADLCEFELEALPIQPGKAKP